MSRGNGKAEVEEARLDAEHELPPAEGTSSTTTGSAMSTPPERNSELERLRSERDELLDRLKRMQAEFDNARKRAAREQQEFRDYALENAIKTLIPVLDSFDRALQSSPEKSEFHAGVELIHKQLQDALAKLGVRPIIAKGELFDPRFHEAIEMVETDEADDQRVLEQLQRGYKLKERLLRPAMVKVARNPQH
jgi:molecular chaperone GrpE